MDHDVQVSVGVLVQREPLAMAAVTTPVALSEGSVVTALQFKSEGPGFDPLAEQGEGQFCFYPSESTLLHT